MTAVQAIIGVLLISAVAMKAVEGLPIELSACPNAFVLCADQSECVRERYICDGEEHCDDGSDEIFCTDKGPIACSKGYFQCSNDNCIPRSNFCDGENDCDDYSDEFYCNQKNLTRCPPSWILCHDKRRCIQGNWKCDGIQDCKDGSDEFPWLCGIVPPTYSPFRPRIPDAVSARNRNINWLLNRRKHDSSTNRWGDQLHRIATALYLADKRFFAPGNLTGEEMGYELTIQLLYKISRNEMIRSQELALYIQALLVTCTDPKDFFNRNLLSELRQRVELKNYTNPFEILVLCNAGDIMADEDVERVATAFDCQYRPFWTDTQAIATMALQCLSSTPNVKVDEKTIKAMQDELKKRQFINGTVDNPMTTALVVQALLYKENYKDYFSLEAATRVMLESQKEDGSWGSVQDSYYILPAISSKSLVNISSHHCKKSHESDEEVLKKLQASRSEKFIVQYSVWIGNDVDLGRTWRLRMSGNHSFYDVIETLRKLDPRHEVKYNVIDDKPYVSALLGKENDPVLGVYWFTYVRSLPLPAITRLVEESPVDVKVCPNQELILWYKPGSWSENSLQNE